MKILMRRLRALSVAFGFDPAKTYRSIRGLVPFFRDLKVLKQQLNNSDREFPIKKMYPCLHDRYADAGLATGHYFHQDLLVARRVYQNNPEFHMDVGSKFDGFVAHVASFREIKVVDIRPLSNELPGIEFIQADMMEPLAEELIENCDSLSCLHALEHFGLGRYDDPVNYDGYRIGFENLYKMLKPNGKLYFSVPIGTQRIEFNAHRVFSPKFLLEMFGERLRVDHFSYVDDQGILHENAALDEASLSNDYGCRFGCGIFEMTKL